MGEAQPPDQASPGVEETTGAGQVMAVQAGVERKEGAKPVVVQEPVSKDAVT
jgi:hypothetical protein